MNNTPPAALWNSSGEHTSGSKAQIAVHLCLDTQGQIWSYHHPQTEQDTQVLQSWPGGGARAIAHALLVEAVRREAFACLLIEMSKDPQFAIRYLQGDAQTRETMEQDLAQSCSAVIQSTIPKVSPGAAKEIFAMCLTGAQP